MKRRHHPLVALGFIVPSCAPAPVAHRGSTAQAPAVADPQPVTAGDRPDDEGVPTSSSSAPVPTTTEPPATIATVSGLPPTTDGTTTTTVRPKPLLTTTLPEYADEAMSDVEWAIRSTFPETPDRAVRIARCESGLDPRAINGQHLGVMQVATVTHAELIADMGYEPADLLDLMVNLKVARAIFDGADGGPPGWAAWSCAA